jgi:hypothetical protein
MTTASVNYAAGCIACFILGFLAWDMARIFRSAQTANKSFNDVSTAKDLAVALLSYASDNDDRLPKEADWKPYIVGLSYRVGLRTQAGHEFELQPLLAGRNLAEVSDAQNTALVAPLSFPPSQLEPGEYTVVGFVDGSAKKFYAQQLAVKNSIKWSPALVEDRTPAASR